MQSSAALSKNEQQQPMIRDYKEGEISLCVVFLQGGSLGSCGLQSCGIVPKYKSLYILILHIKILFCKEHLRKGAVAIMLVVTPPIETTINWASA